MNNHLHISKSHIKKDHFNFSTLPIQKKEGCTWNSLPYVFFKLDFKITRLQWNVLTHVLIARKKNCIDGNMNISVNETQNHELHGRLNIWFWDYFFSLERKTENTNTILNWGNGLLVHTSRIFIVDNHTCTVQSWF